MSSDALNDRLEVHGRRIRGGRGDIVPPTFWVGGDCPPHSWELLERRNWESWAFIKVGKSVFSNFFRGWNWGRTAFHSHGVREAFGASKFKSATPAEMLKALRWQATVSHEGRRINLKISFHLFSSLTSLERSALFSHKDTNYFWFLIYLLGLQYSNTILHFPVLSSKLLWVLFDILLHTLSILNFLACFLKL